jgi:hypothetical protein
MDVRMARAVDPVESGDRGAAPGGVRVAARGEHDTDGGARIPVCRDRIEAAVKQVLAQGLRTPDIWSEGTTKVGTREMGDAVVKALG